MLPQLHASLGFVSSVPLDVPDRSAKRQALGRRAAEAAAVTLR
jgi:hypothetical protein